MHLSQLIGGGVVCRNGYRRAHRRAGGGHRFLHLAQAAIASGARR